VVTFTFFRVLDKVFFVENCNAELGKMYQILNKRFAKFFDSCGISTNKVGKKCFNNDFSTEKNLQIFQIFIFYRYSKADSTNMFLADQTLQPTKFNCCVKLLYFLGDNSKFSLSI